MKIYNATPEIVAEAFDATRRAYGYNIRWKQAPTRGDSRKPFISCGLTVVDTYRHPNETLLGVKVNPNTGRRISACCWHVFRDFMREIFRRAPDAEIRTFVTYKGSKDFEARHRYEGDPQVTSDYAGGHHFSDCCNCADRP